MERKNKKKLSIHFELQTGLNLNEFASQNSIEIIHVDVFIFFLIIYRLIHPIHPIRDMVKLYLIINMHLGVIRLVIQPEHF
jgi:hypothetical protein